MLRSSQHPVMTLCTHNADTVLAACAHTKTKTKTKTKTHHSEPFDGFPMEMGLWAYEGTPRLTLASLWTGDQPVIWGTA